MRKGNWEYGFNKNEILKYFFYIVVINYFIYGLNVKYFGEWINFLFYKNDVY